MSTAAGGPSIAAALPLLVSLLVPAGAAAQNASFRWSETMRAGAVLEVRGITGEIRAERAEGRTASVMAEKQGRPGDLADVDIRVMRESDGFTVCAIYHPHEGDGGDCDHDDDRGDGRRHNRDIDVDVDYLVRLPDGVRLVAGMVSGDVTVVDVRSNVDASSVSGDVYVSTTGVAEASSVSGSLDVEMGSMDWDRLSFNTVSGEIILTLPAALEATLEFESLSGDLDSDFELELNSGRARRWIGSHIRGVIGRGGGREISLHTVSGDVRLRRGR